MRTSAHLPDINVWLALAFEVHAHHRRAVSWFSEVAPAGSAFCRFTQQGFLRLATNPSVFGEEALTMAAAWSCYDKLLNDERVYYSTESGDLEPLWRRHTNRGAYSPKVWSDAYLAAFAGAARMSIVSFDRGFRQYKGLEATILS